MNTKHQKTLIIIFSKSTSKNLEWRSIESLLIGVGAQKIEGAGSRVRFILQNIMVTFHRPHPQKEAKPYQVKDARLFLERAGITP